MYVATKNRKGGTAVDGSIVPVEKALKRTLDDEGVRR